MVSFAALLAVVWTATLVAADPMTWTPCDAGQTSFVPSSVTLSPDPPVIGTPAVFVITGTIGESYGYFACCEVL